MPVLNAGVMAVIVFALVFLCLYGVSIVHLKRLTVASCLHMHDILIVGFYTIVLQKNTTSLVFGFCARVFFAPIHCLLPFCIVSPTLWTLLLWTLRAWGEVWMHGLSWGRRGQTYLDTRRPM